ncbi:hypothetical protein [Nitrospirillum viridazoti]|uniref:Uncharacterized protein n=1 Tax=Nitrospirillum amazonense TaxID=28077 RepID=A0A560I8Q1_9PROT|nr:hypothetical protein [Nitrospirillum amazonense]TWB54379.1 hypothetical protein FBZ92_115147 [Nitrospirillum amazonense]
MTDGTNAQDGAAAPAAGGMDARDHQRWDEWQDDVRIMLGYAAGRGLALERTVIDTAVRVTATPPERLSLEDKQALWVVYQALSVVIAPATSASLRHIREFRRELGLAGWWRSLTRAGLVQRTIRSGVLWLVSAALVTAIVQIHAANGTNLLAQTGVRQLLFIEGAAAQRPMGDGGADTNTQGTSTLTAAQEPLVQLRRQAAAKLLAPWICHPLSRVVTLSFDAHGYCQRRDAGAPAAPSGEDADTILLHTVELAWSAGTALTLYVLPALFGLLGACAYIARVLTEAVVNASFMPQLGFRMVLRRALGLTLGLATGLFYKSVVATIEPTASAQISLLGAAFLAGYSVEAVFAMFDAAVDKLREVFKPRDAASRPAALAPAAGPQAVPKEAQG